MSQNPDAIETGPMPPGEAGILARQLMEAGYKGAFGRMGTGSEQIVKGLGGVDKVTKLYWWDAVPTEDPGIVKMSADYERLMKGPLPENTLVYSAQLAAEQILNAVTRAGTSDDVEKIAAELRKVPPESRYLGQGRVARQDDVQQQPAACLSGRNGLHRQRQERAAASCKHSWRVSSLRRAKF